MVCTLKHVCREGGGVSMCLCVCVCVSVRVCVTYDRLINLYTVFYIHNMERFAGRLNRQ